MTNKYKVLMIFGFQMAGVNYLISDYMLPSLACMAIAFMISMEMNKKSSGKQLLTSFGFSLILNMAIFFLGNELLNNELRNLILKLALSQSLIESGLLILLCNGESESRSLLKYTGTFFLIICVLIFIIPHEVLDHFVYSTMKGNGAMSLFILCGEIFIPIICCTLVGILYNELTIKKEPNHFFGSIK